MGHWIRRKHFIQHFFSLKHQWVIRDHPHWLSPIESESTLSTVEVMEESSNRGFLMLAKMDAYDFGWREKQRWVLVDDDWGMRVHNTQ